MQLNRVFVVLGSVILAVLCLVLASPGTFSQPQKSIKAEITGTVTDASGASIGDGEVHVSFAGGAVGDFKRRFNKGTFTLTIDFPAGKPLPLMEKLTFYVEGFPPRWVNHLSPRVPPGRTQDIHIVMYTDEQLKKANASDLLLEGYQMEESLISWMRADKSFKADYHKFFAASRLETRRRVIYAHWPDAAERDGLPKAYSDYLRSRFSDKSQMAAQMKTLLPSE